MITTGWLPLNVVRIFQVDNKDSITRGHHSLVDVEEGGKVTLNRIVDDGKLNFDFRFRIGTRTQITRHDDQSDDR